MDRVERLKASLPAGASLPEIALRFVLQHPAVSTTIVGMRKEAHVRENCALSDGMPLAADPWPALRPPSLGPKSPPWSD